MLKVLLKVDHVGAAMNFERRHEDSQALLAGDASESSH
jgi:hypothetical protein